MNHSTTTELKEEQILILNEFNLKLKHLDSFYQNRIESSPSNVSQLKFLDFSVAKIVNSTVEKLSVVNENIENMPLVHEKINSIVCNFTQNYPDMPQNKISELCNKAIEPIKPVKQTSNILQTSGEATTINKNSNERCFNLIENPIVIPSVEDEPAILTYSFEYNPAFQVTNEKKSEPKTKEKNIKRKFKTGIQDFHVVLNVGFGYSLKGIILKCFADHCNYKSYDRHILQAHYENFHITTKLEGVCGMCDNNLNIRNLSEEMDHIYDSHMKDTTKQKKDDTLSTVNVSLTVESNQTDLNSVTQLMNDEPTDLSYIIQSMNNDLTDSICNTESMVDAKQIDELIKILEDTNDSKIIPETLNTTSDNCLINQDSDISSSNSSSKLKIVSEDEKEVYILSPFSDNEVPDSSSVSLSHSADLVVPIPSKKRKKSNKSLSNKLTCRKISKRISNNIDLEPQVVKKKYKVDKIVTEKPTATTNSRLFLRVNLVKLSEETIAKYLQVEKPESPKSEAQKTSDHKKSLKSKQDKNKDLNQISHKSIQITKKPLPTVFKRSLSLKQSKSEISPEKSAAIDEAARRIEPLKIIMKKCDINDYKTSYKVLNVTKHSNELDSSEENSLEINTIESNVTTELPKQSDQVTKPAAKIVSPTKLFSEILLELNQASKSVKRSNSCFFYKSPSRAATTSKKVEPKNIKVVSTMSKSKSNSQKQILRKSCKKPTESLSTASVLKLSKTSKSPFKNDPLICKDTTKIAKKSSTANVLNISPISEDESPLTALGLVRKVPLITNKKTVPPSTVVKSSVTLISELFKINVVPSSIVVKSSVNSFSEPTKIIEKNTEEPPKKVKKSALEVVPSRTVVTPMNNKAKGSVLEPMPSTSNNPDQNYNEKPPKIALKNIQEPLITKPTENTELSYGKFIVETINFSSPLKSNDKPTSSDKDLILAELTACTFPTEMNSPQKSHKSWSPSSIKTLSPSTRSSSSIKTLSSSTSSNCKKINRENFSLLQPWLPKRRYNKYNFSMRKQLQPNGLLAQFKCMGFTCSFFTCDNNVFKRHLKRHQECVNQGSQDTFLFCSYCLYKTLNIDKLIDHVTTAHRLDRYQCSYCFYRSSEAHSCATHLNTYHSFQKNLVIECPIYDLTIDDDSISKRLIYNRSKYVAPLRCSVCDKCYFLGEEYVDHMKTHINERHEHDVRNGIKLMQKLFDENHYGLHQCLYCVYGTKNEDEMRVHLSNCHPSDFTYYCKRQSASKNINSAESLESTQIIKLGEHKNISIKKYRSDITELINRENWSNVNDRDSIIKMTSSNTSEMSCL